MHRADCEILSCCARMDRLYVTPPPPPPRLTQSDHNLNESFPTMFGVGEKGRIYRNIHTHVQFCPVTEFKGPDRGAKVNSCIYGLSYRPARLHGLAGRYDNPMPESTLSAQLGIYEFGFCKEWLSHAKKILILIYWQTGSQRQYAIYFYKLLKMLILNFLKNVECFIANQCYLEKSIH
jgi:hypothetical protein